MSSQQVSQKEGVFAAVVEIIGAPEAGTKVKLTKDELETVELIVAKGLMDGSISFSADARAKHDTEEKVLKYVGGMVNNWLRKDTRLNGGEKYETKNPGSRAGSGDEQLKELRRLRSTLTNASEIAKVDEFIKNRLVELQAVKNKDKVKTINADLIPEDLKHLLKVG